MAVLLVIQDEPISPILFRIAEEVICKAITNKDLSGHLKLMLGSQGTTITSNIL